MPLFPHQPKPIRVLIVDDHAGYAASLTAILSGNPRLVVVGRAADGLDAIELARLLRPDVVVMDVNMPRLDGFSASRLIRRDREDVRIVIVSGEPRLDHPSRARQAGADVYLPKDVDFVTLTNVVAGETSGEEPGTFSVAFATAI
jgi:DNA-binding NarL/FixJ family response regulator